MVPAGPRACKSLSGIPKGHGVMRSRNAVKMEIRDEQLQLRERREARHTQCCGCSASLVKSFTGTALEPGIARVSD